MRLHDQAHVRKLKLQLHVWSLLGLENGIDNNVEGRGLQGTGVAEFVAGSGGMDDSAS